MIISVDDKSPVPPFEQIRSQVTAMIDSGVMPPGERIPSIRQLAVDLDLAPGTVSRAVRELEHDGLIETRGRHGTFVIGQRRAVSTSERSERLSAAAHEYALASVQLGASRADAHQALDIALDDRDWRCRQ